MDKPKFTPFELTCKNKFATFDVDISLLIEQLSTLSWLNNRMPTLERDAINGIIPVLEKFVDVVQKGDALDLAYQQSKKLPTPQAIIYMGGGLIQEVWLDNICENTRFVLVDEDTDGGDPSCIMRCDPTKFHRQELYVCELPTQDIEDSNFGYLRDRVNEFLQENNDKNEDSRFPISDWQYEVANGDTRLGYQKWVETRKELAEEIGKR